MCAHVRVMHINLSRIVHKLHFPIVLLNKCHVFECRSYPTFRMFSISDPIISVCADTARHLLDSSSQTTTTPTEI